MPKTGEPGNRYDAPRACMYAERGCDFTSDWPPALGRHRMRCEYAPKTRASKKDTDVSARKDTDTGVHANGKAGGGGSRVTRFAQQQNVDVATALLIAAKYPKGVPVDEIPAVINLIHTLDHV